MVSNRAAISELPTMSYVVATFVSTGGERLSFETLMFSYNYAPPNLTVSHIHGDTIIYGATGGGGVPAKRCGPSGCVLFVLGLRCVPSVRAVEGLKSRATPRLKTIRARMAISGRLPGISDLSSVHTRPQRVEHAKHQSGFTTQAQSSGQQRLASIPPHHEHQLKEPTHNLHLLSYLRPMVSDGGLAPSINCGRMGKKGLVRVSQK